jgi:hypothetical protein
MVLIELPIKRAIQQIIVQSKASSWFAGCEPNIALRKTGVVQ